MSPEPSLEPCQCAGSGISAPETCFVGDEDDITITGTCLDDLSPPVIPGGEFIPLSSEKNAAGHIVAIKLRVKWTTPGEHTLSATCGESSATTTVKVYKVDIEWNGQIVTDGTVPRIVGQPIALKAIIEPAPPAGTTYLWSLPSKSIRNYHVIMREIDGSNSNDQEFFYDTKACVEGVSELAKSASSILFHIYGIPQNTKASLKVTIASREKQVSTDVVITRPSAFFRAFIGNGNPVVQIVNNNKVACGVPDLPLATDPRRGIRFEAEMDPFEGGAGQIAFVQLIDSQRHITTVFIRA